MRSVVAIASALAGLVLAALIGRRELTNRVAGQLPGAAVELATMTDVLDVGHRIWRGPVPTAGGYAELAASGCSLIVDLRSEVDAEEIHAAAEAVGMRALVLPINNSRPPAPVHVDVLARALAETSGVAYVHCEAGEGRTGALIGAYAVRHGAAVRDAIEESLAVGSLTFAQLVYIATAGRAGGLANVVDLFVDRPTEALIHSASRAVR